MRALIFIGAWTLFRFSWNFFFPGDVTVLNRYDAEVHMTSVFPPISLLTYLIGLVVAYGLAWINVINEWERRPVLRFGKYVRTAGPGLTLIEPLIHTTLPDIPVQDVSTELAIDNVQTKDNVGLSLLILLTSRINSDKVRDAVVNVEDVDDAVEERTLSSVTSEIAKVDLDHVLGERDQFLERIRTALVTRVANWGVTIVAVEIKSLKINDTEVEQAIAMKARAQKEGEAELERAGFQVRVAEKLKVAASHYNDDARWLKGTEVLVELCRSANNNTVIIPSDFMSSLAGMTPKALTEGLGKLTAVGGKAAA